MRFALGAFTSESLEATFGPDLDRGIGAAVRHYSRRLAAATGFPTQAPPRLPEIAAAPVVLVVEIEPLYAVPLEAEARRLGVDLQRLLLHAVLVCLADLDRRGDVAKEGVPPRR